MKRVSKLIAVISFIVVALFLINVPAFTLKPQNNAFNLPSQELMKNSPSFIDFTQLSPSDHAALRSLDDLTAMAESMVKENPVVNMNFTKLERYIEKLSDYNRFRGSFAVYYQNSTWSYQTGPLSPVNDTTPNVHTKYRIGSISKTYTAVLTMQAIERGHFSLDTPLEQFFPYATYGIKFSDKITIRHLLNHRSGLFNYTNDPEFGIFKPNRTLKDIIDTINKFSDHQPDPDTITEGSYTNSGFYLLGEILSMIYDIPFLTVLEREILTPLNLTETSFYSLPEQEHPAPFTEKNEVSGYMLNYTNHFQGNAVYTDASCAYAAGAVLSNVGDMISYFKQVFVEHKVISKESIALMREFQPLVEGINYGLGLFEFTVNNATGFGHNGAIDGFLSQLTIMPTAPGGDPVNGDDYFIIAYSVNAYATAQQYVSSPIMATAYGLPWEIPDYDKEDNQDNYEAYTGLWVADSLPNVNFTVYPITHIVPPIPNHTKNLVLTAPGLTIPLPMTYYDHPELYVILNLNAVVQFNREQNKAILFQNGYEIVCSKKKYLEDISTTTTPSSNEISPSPQPCPQKKRFMNKFNKY